MNSETRYRTYYVLCDYIAGVAAMLIFNILRYEYFVSDNYRNIETFLSSLPVAAGIVSIPVGLLWVYYLSGYYVKVMSKSRIDDFLNTLVSTLVCAILVYFIVIANDPIRERGKVMEIICSLWLILFVMTYALRTLITISVVRKARRHHGGFNTLVIGTSQAAEKLVERLTRSGSQDEFNVVGYVSVDDTPIQPGLSLPVYKLSDLKEKCEELDIKQLIAMPHPNGITATLSMLEMLFPTGCSIFVSPLLFQIISGRSSFGNIAGEPLIDISSPDIPPMTAAIKRAFDVVCSVIFMILLIPVYVAVGIAVKFDSPGPVLYRQERIGLHKRKFKILKFRTMKVDAETDGPALSSPTDPRVTRVGHFLRKYRIDEFPQFWNVIVGDMSIVGPRPEREHYAKMIVERVPYYTLVHGVRPGITSWGMVKYGYAQEVDQMVERLQYDLIYLENISMGVDLKIIAYTVKTVITGRGI